METLTFTRLTELELGSSKRAHHKNKGFNPTRFLSITKGAPSLKMLCLQRCDINLEFLEGLHANCIHLQSLILKEVMVVIDNEYLLETITPASSILKLEITDYSVIVDTSMSYLDYIVKKYVNLQSLSVSIHMQEDERATASAISSYYGVIQRSHRIFRGHTDAQIEGTDSNRLFYYTSFSLY
jgi:hypothetical protein